MKRLLHLNAFTPETITELARSTIAELRVVVVANLIDQSLLSRLVVEDKDSIVREAAKERLVERHR